MYARVATYSGDAAALVEGFESVTAPLERIDGFNGALVLVDREGGRATTVTLWESEDALRASAGQAERLRRDATQQAGASVEGVDGYEVALVVGLAPQPGAAASAGEGTVPPGA